MRLTRQGWIVAAGAALLFVGGRVLGLTELFALGAVCLLLLAFCGLWVGLKSLDLSVTRSVTPHRVHAGNPCTVEIAVRNRGVRATPVLEVVDPVTGTAGADLLLAPIGLRATSHAAYRLPTQARGLLQVGPMTVTIADPFGLARTVLRAAPALEVTVLPRVEDIPPMPRTVGPDPDGGADQSASVGRNGEDFAALRPYVVGDDLRRVHWPSSARTLDDLLIRQDDVPWQGRLTVLLDVRREANDVDTIERAVSAAASVLRAHVRRGDHVRLVTTDGTDTGFGVGPGHLDAILEYLAVAERSPRGSFRGALDRVERASSGALVVISGRPADADIDAVGRLPGGTAVRRIVRLDRAGRGAIGRHTDVVGVPPGTSFGETWRQASPPGRRGPSRRGRVRARVGRS